MDKLTVLQHVRTVASAVAEVSPTAYREMAPQLLRAVLAYLEEGDINDCGLRGYLWQGTDYALTLSRSQSHIHPDFQRRNERALEYHFERFERALEEWRASRYAKANAWREMVGLPPVRRKEGNQTKTFTVVVEKDEDGIYIISVLELPGCHTQASKTADIETRIKEAIAAYIGEEECNIRVSKD